MIAGLEPLFTPQECQRVYDSIAKFNAAPTKFGLINGGNFQGDSTVAGDPNNNHGTMIFVGGRSLKFDTDLGSRSLDDNLMVGVRYAF